MESLFFDNSVALITVVTPCLSETFIEGIGIDDDDGGKDQDELFSY